MYGVGRVAVAVTRAGSEASSGAGDGVAGSVHQVQHLARVDERDHQRVL